MLTKKEEDTAVVKPNTKARPFRSYSCCWKEMDRHWDTAVSRWKVLGGVKNHHPIANTQPNMQKQIPTTHTNLDLINIDHVLSNGTHAGSNAMLFVFEAVMKKIMKGRSPTMRHVSRNHRVALDWLCDRINLDSEIQIRYIYTKHQLADISTKGNFTRDQWNNLH